MTTDTAEPNVYDPEPDRESPPVVDLPPSKYLFTLTGFDEIAIAARFGEKLSAIRASDGLTLGRALAFVEYRRQGLNDKEAHDACLGLTLRQVVDYFPPEPKAEPVDLADDASAEGNAPSST